MMTVVSAPDGTNPPSQRISQALPPVTQLVENKYVLYRYPCSPFHQWEDNLIHLRIWISPFAVHFPFPVGRVPQPIAVVSTLSCTLSRSTVNFDDVTFKCSSAWSDGDFFYVFEQSKQNLYLS